MQWRGGPLPLGERDRRGFGHDSVSCYGTSYEMYFGWIVDDDVYD